MSDISKRIYGKDYADNIIDELLQFNRSQTWSITSGTGAASIDTNNLFEGFSSLKIQNTAPTTDFKITNSVQSTVIKNINNYNFSLYLYKDEVDEFFELDVEIFKGLTLIGTESLTIGSETPEEDVNKKWIRFMSPNQYPLEKGDEISFTFTLKAKAGTSLLSSTVFVDGMMLNECNRISQIVPTFTKPNRFKDLPNLPTGDGNYQLTVLDNVYTWTEIL